MLPALAIHAQCVNSSHLALTPTLLRPCPDGFRCLDDVNACQADDIWEHLSGAADFQMLEPVPVGEAQACSGDAAVDAARGLMLCEMLSLANRSKPRFGHGLGSTWHTAPATRRGEVDGCTFSTAAGWRACIGANLGRLRALLQAVAPDAMFSGGLFEYLAESNVDGDRSAFEACCKPGTIGKWGSSSTCVPDITSAGAQGYYEAWGRTFLDAGIRAIFFGQARLTGGGRPCRSDGTGCSRVSAAGVTGFAKVVRALRLYATSKGYGHVYFAPQAASGFEGPDGEELAEWVYGAQHLFASGRHLLQPLGVAGRLPALAPQWYGTGDFHDANRLNAANGLPIREIFARCHPRPRHR